MKRRDFVVGLLTSAALPVWAGTAAAVTQEELLKPGPLPEKIFGSPDAPVTVIEYASLTCPHCRTFHMNTWPAVKEKYVDTGKVRFIMREFAFDARASGGFMLARCVPDDKWYAVIDLLYRSQANWARAQDSVGAMKNLMGMTGMGADQVETCLRDQALLEKVTGVMTGGQALGVDSTPTFFINGEKTTGALTIDQFSAIVDPMITAAE